jgi:plasmid replication initiation protein
MELAELRVTKSNELIQASYKLSLNEQRLILASIGQLDGRKPPPSGKAFRVHAQDFSRTFGVDTRDAYAAIKDASDTLYERDIRTYDGRNRERFRWVQRVRYVEGEGYVELWFSDAVLPYLTLLHTRFTSYNLSEIAQLRSTYAIRLFEMLMQFKDKGLLVLKLDAFRERLELTGQYDRFDNLRARVIEPAVSELRAKANLQVTWRGIRAGRKVVTLEFRFKSSDQLALAI